MIDILENRRYLTVSYNQLDVNPSVFVEPVALDGIFYFQGRKTDESKNNELWRSDGTPSGTRPVIDLLPGLSGSSPRCLTVFKNQVFFEAGSKLYKTNGTELGTVLVHNFNNGTIYEMHVLGDKLIIVARDPTNNMGMELWVSDGTDVGTVCLDTVPGPEGNLIGGRFASYKDKLVFVGSDNATSLEPWLTDGTKSGTQILKDIIPGGHFTSNANFFTEFNGKLYFSAYTPENGMELWVSDGTSQGTKIAKDFIAGAGDSFAKPLLVLNNELYISTYFEKEALFKMDIKGTISLLNEYKIAPELATNFDGEQFLLDGESLSGEKGLWLSDGTIAGTRIISDIGLAGVGRVYGGYAIFTGYSTASGAEIFVTDGTTAGTTLLIDTVQGTNSGQYQKMIGIGNKVFVVSSPRVNLAFNQLFVVTIDSSPVKSQAVTIKGRVFSDSNSNNIFDSIDQTVGAKLVFIDSNNDGVYQAGEKSMLSAADGSYMFEGLSAGLYSLRVQLSAGQSQTTSSLSITVGAGQTARLDVGIQTSAPTGASITGYVFNDANKNMARESAEVGLANITLWLDLDGDKIIDAGERTTTSDAQGNYSFSNVPITGSSTSTKVRAVIPSGASQTLPSNGYGYSVNLAVGASNTKKDFGIYMPSVVVNNASISGLTFNDDNSNGVYDTGEVKTSGRTIYLDQNLNGVFETGEVSVLTDINGVFTFTGLAAGTYHVRRVFGTGYVSSTPLIDITLTAGQQVSGLLMGAKLGTVTPPTKGSIAGFLFFDTNKNGTYDKGDTYQSGKTVFIDLDGDGVLDTNETKLTTNASGAFKFANLVAGTYKIRRVMPVGYKVTTPARNITISAGQNVTGVTIGSANS